MSFDELKSSLKEMTEKMAAVKLEYTELGKKTLAEGLKQVLAGNDSVKSITWTQRGADFSDGDYSKASISDYYSIRLFGDTDADEDDDEGEYDEVGTWGLDKEPEDVQTAYKNLRALLDAVGDDTLFTVYGENTKVTVHSDGRVTESEYYYY